MTRPRRPQLPDHNRNAEAPSPVAPPGARRVRGTVINCDPDGHVYHVATPQGTATMPRLRSFPGDVALIPNDTPVVVDYSLGQPYIAGILPPESVRTEGRPEAGVTGTSGFGGQDPVMNRSYGASARAANEPNDLLPGDLAVQGPDGSSVVLGHGPLAMLSAGPLAQLRLFGDTDAAQLIAGLLHVVTWMGEARVLNEDGKTSFVWRGGADQLTQTGADEQRYTLRLDLGHRGDLVKFEVTTPRGQTLFRFHVSPEGRLEVFAAGGIDQTDGGAVTPVRVAGDRETRVVGNDTTTVGGAATRAYEAGRTDTVTGNDRLVVTQDRAENVGRDLRTLVGGRGNATYGGGLNQTVTGDCVTTVRGGNVTIDATGVVTIRTSTAEALRFGRNARFHAVNYEDLRAQLQVLQDAYNNLLGLLASHVHGLGPVSPTLQSLPATPLSLDLNSFKNQDVLL